MLRCSGLVACVSLSACVVTVESDEWAIGDDERAVPGDVSETEPALMGGTDFDASCTWGQREYMRQAMMVGRTIARSNAFAECIRHALGRGGVEGCSGDPYRNGDRGTYVSKVVEIVRSPNEGYLETCHREIDSDGMVDGNDRHDYAHGGAERMHIYDVPSIDELSSNIEYYRAYNQEPSDPIMTRRLDSFAGQAAMTWHEALHTHGYDDCNQYADSTPAAVQGCMSEVAALSADQCEVVSACAGGARLAIVSRYGSPEGGCVCVRDAEDDGSGTDRPATPRLSRSEDLDRYGEAVAAGDFNDDGFDDLAVGAPGDQSGRGAVFIYLGTAFGVYPAYALDAVTLPALPVGNGSSIRRARGDGFGASLAAADFNADGRSDLAVGIPGFARNRGRVALFLGTPDRLVPRRLLTQVGDEASGDEFGFSLATGGFFEGDVALAVGAPGESLDGVRSGAVQIFAGSSDSLELVSPWGTASEAASARSNGARFGASVAFGKMGSSGHALLVGAPYDGVGKVHVFDARAYDTAPDVPSSVRPSYTIVPSDPYASSFGHAVAAGMSFADGGPTIAIGSPSREGPTGVARGGVYFFRDRRSASSMGPEYEPTFVVSGRVDGELFGYALRQIGNDGSGRDQLLIGAPGRSGGRVFRIDRVTSGASVTTKVISVTSEAGLGRDEKGDQMGRSLAVGDFDGDLRRDFVVGAPYEAPASDLRSGAVFAFRWNEERHTYEPVAAYAQDD